MELKTIRNWFFCCLLFLSGDLGAQGIFHVKEPPGDYGVLLNESWKYMPGDQAEWALPGYNDSAWTSIEPTKDFHHLPQLVPGKISWFRLRFTTSALASTELAMVMQQAGASEIFLDGKLIHRLGTVSQDPAAIIAFDPIFNPLGFYLSEQADHVLAIRYVLQPGVHYTTMFEFKNPTFQIRLYYLEDAITVYRNFSITHGGFLFFIGGVCVLLFVLHFAFYLFYPAQKANLTFACYAFLFLVFNCLQYRMYFYGNHVADKFYLGNLAMDLRTGCNLLLLSSLYNLLEQRRDTYFWVFICLSVLSVALNIWPYDIGWKMGGALMELLVGAGVVRIAYRAMKEQKRGARIILAGVIFYFLFFAIFFCWLFFLPKEYFLNSLPFLRIILYVLSFLGIPVATSIFLGLDFAFANRSLQAKLLEVEALSAKSIAQEKDKQEILAAQNITLEQQVTDRTMALTKSLEELKSTQDQLIQSEKMASLGELTAGIAHEIQNPLNFVNNFSDVNQELIIELTEEAERGNIGDVKQIAENIKVNEAKINYHGKRAEAIVKNMLQHSHTNSGQMEPTDINALCDEYLRLSYHGLRAKDKSFNAILETDYGLTVGKAKVIPQDIGRVLLNLFNNAFYAVSDKKKRAESDYHPTVSISTRRVDDKVQIIVRDNGFGIPEKLQVKIFQPFFTTKPTGQGTGLGLSLSYDIITKGHNGRLMVESEEGKGAIFVIQFPTE